MDQKTESGDEGSLPEPVMKVLQDLKTQVEGLKNPEPVKPAPASTGPSWSERREAERQALGFTEDQMRAHEQTISRVNAPVMERTAWATIEKRPDIDTFRKEIEEELKIYPQERRTPEIMEKIYYFVRGKHADSKPSTPAPSRGVERTRISGGPGYTGSDPSLAPRNKEESTEEAEQLDDREKFVIQKFRESGVDITEKEYAKSRNVGRSIRELRVPDQRQASTMADIELRRMTGRK